jgi:hypothetical protein
MQRLLIVAFFWFSVLPLALGTPKREPIPARDVLEQFCELDAKGQLSPQGWQKLARLFTQPGAPQTDSIVVVRDFVVSLPNEKDGRAEFYVEYIRLGTIDSSRARLSLLPPIKVRAGFHTVKSLGSDVNAAGKASPANVEWRIEGSPPEPHLSVESAIAYLSVLRNRSPDGSVKKNAERSISVLRKLEGSNTNP